MISRQLAVRLQAVGLTWSPAAGDRFWIPDRDLDDEVFVISDMTIETQELETGAIVRFNGTTEWALDSIQQDAVVWLPREAQLRSLLGSRFLRLEAVPEGYAVVLSRTDGSEQPGGRYVDIDAECAYGRALLAVLAADPAAE